MADTNPIAPQENQPHFERARLAYRLPNIPYVRLRFSLIAQIEAYLPAYKGSLLRGAFGHALRRTVCVMGPQQPCPTCMLRRQCAYPRIFETLIEPNEPVPRFLRGLPTGPQPYVFEPFDEQRLYRVGDSLQFDFILLGQAIELHPFAIFAVSQMAEQGLGFKRMPFRLENCHWHIASSQELESGEEKAEGEWRLLYDGASKRLLETPTPQLTNPDFPSISIKENRGELANEPTDKPSHRLTVNFVGEMVLEGDLAPFEELLSICEVVHVGKGCVFGNGKMVCHIAS